MKNDENEEDVVAKSLPSAPITQKEDNRLRIGYEGTEQKETGKTSSEKDRLGYEERWLSGRSDGLGLFGKIGGAVVSCNKPTGYKWISSFRD